MTNDDGIIFDPSSGISVEEQQDILAKINSIAEKNRQSLSQSGVAGAGKKQRFKAKKSGGAFPVVVNVSALVLLAGGLLLLSSFQGKTEAQVREGARVYNSAERTLLDEIRIETASKIALKEDEIALVISQLEGIEVELEELHSSNQELTGEQLAAQARLLALQEEHLLSMALLQEERSLILEESRANEAALRAQLESRTSELASGHEELSLARSELERLTNDMERAAAIEAQLGGGFASVHDLIRRDRLAEASEALANLRLFLNTPSFQRVRSIQSRRDFYTQTINSLEALVDETRKNQAAGYSFSEGDAERELNNLQLKNTQLEETVSDMNRTIAALSSGSTGLAEHLAELEITLSDLRTEKTSLEINIADQDRLISSLEAETAGLAQTVSVRDGTIRNLQTTNASQADEISNLNTQLVIVRQAMQAMQEFLDQ
ncbi:MAG: hypothetical protein FWG99_06210 [Treponema sp.]|nr:hypothetical protein [Treponema sp.]